VLRFLTAGESHGKALVVVVEGLPAGLPVEASDIGNELARRRLGYGRGPRMRFEADEITLVGGIRHGRTLGSPVAIEIANSEWPKWTEEMSPDPGAPTTRLTQPRPGHADLPGMLKYGFDDARDVLERASARETAARVAAGTLAKLLLSQLGVSIVSHIVRLGEAATGPDSPRPGPADLDQIDESHTLFGDSVVPGSRCASLQGKQVKTRNIRHMRGRPTVVTIGDVGGDSLCTRHRNQRSDEALLYGVVHLRQAHDRGMDSALHQCDGRHLGYTRKRGGRERWIVLGGGAALGHSDAGADDERTAGALERAANGLDNALI